MIVQIGDLKKGLNPLSVSDLVFTSPYMSTALKTGLITGIIALAVSHTPSYTLLFSFFQTGKYRIYRLFMELETNVTTNPRNLYTTHSEQF